MAESEDEGTIEFNSKQSEGAFTQAEPEASVASVQHQGCPEAGSVTPESSEIEALKHQLMERDESLEANMEIIESLKHKIKSRDASIEELTQRIAEKDETLTLNQQAIDSLKLQLSQRDTTFAAMKDKTKQFIENLNNEHAQALATKESQYVAQLSDKDQQIAMLQNHLQNKEKTITQQASSSAAMSDMQDKIVKLEGTVEALKKELGISLQKCKRLEEERQSLKETSAQSLTEILASQEESQKKMTELIATNKQLELQINSLKEELRTSIDERDEAHESRDDLIVQHEELRKQILKLKQELEQSESERNRTEGEGVGEVIAVKADLEAKVRLLEMWKEENAELQGQLSDVETKLVVMEKRCNEMSRHNEELVSIARSKEEQLSNLQKNYEDREANGRQQLIQGKQRTQEVMSELESIRSSLIAKTAECDAQKSALDAANYTITSLQEKCNSMKTEIDRLNTQLKHEIEQNEDRKKKVREFVKTANSEKTALENRIKELEAKVAESAAEHQIDEEKLTAVNKLLHEKETLLKENEQLQLQLRAEVDHIQEHIAIHSNGKDEKIQEIQKQLQSTKEELEGYRVKRMAARTEMIGMAQALEKAQKEGEGLKNFINNTIAPLVFNQISYLETLVTGIEFANHQIASKKTYLVQSALINVMKQLCFKPQDKIRLNADSSDGDNSPKQLASSLHSDNGSVLQSSLSIGATSGTRKGVAGGGASLRDSGNATGVGLAAITAVASAHQQAESLKAELERVISGLTLLSQSMEKLKDTVRADSRCCGGVFDLISTSSALPDSASTHSPSPSPTTRFRGLATRGRRRGYDRVDGGGGFFADDDDDVRSGGVSHAVISPLGGAVNNNSSRSSYSFNSNKPSNSQNGDASGRTGSTTVADNSKFTIESEEEEGDD